MPRTGKKAPPKDKYGIDNRGTFSVLTDELYAQIEELVKSGANNAKIIRTLGINESTWYTWLYRDTSMIKDKLAEWRRVYLLALAEDKLTELANSQNERIALDAVRFLAERLGKANYATRSEYQIDEKEGKEIEPENKEKLSRLLKPLQNKDNTTIPSPFVQDLTKE